MKGNGKRVYVGLSGGVDSAVSAALLKKDGYEVTGCFIRGWHPDYLTCTWKEDRRDAMRVAAQLDIPFMEFDASEHYKKLVVDEMTAAYDAGLTPNPDILCNEKIKFGVFYDFAMAEGADYIATGHYARSENGELLVSADPEKDQTYFLWAVPSERIAKTIFPVGGYAKKEVRTLAEKFHIPVSGKKDSQGVCFLGQLDLEEFMSKHLKMVPGAVLDTHGKKIGTHGGAQAYTKGQRHGFSIDQTRPDAEPLYVISKDIEANTITVGPKEALTSTTVTMTLSRTNWIRSSLRADQKALVRIRHRGELHRVTIIEVGADEAIIRLDEPISAISEGQSAVIYEGKRCLGGGIIASDTIHL